MINDGFNWYSDREKAKASARKVSGLLDKYMAARKEGPQPTTVVLWGRVFFVMLVIALLLWLLWVL